MELAFVSFVWTIPVLYVISGGALAYHSARYDNDFTYYTDIIPWVAFGPMLWPIVLPIGCVYLIGKHLRQRDQRIEKVKDEIRRAL